MNVLVTILQAGQLLGVIANVGMDIALKIKGLFSVLGNDITVNIHTIDGNAVTANNETIAISNAWLVENGFPPVDVAPTTLLETPAPSPDPAPIPDPAPPADPGSTAG